jgi:hypothetical protein
MAVVDKYVDADLANGKLASALNAQGTKTVKMVATVSVAAGDDDNSVYRLFPSIPSSLVPVSIMIHNTAITNGTDWDLGLFKPNEGEAVDADALADGLTMASARAIGTANNAGMGAVSLSDGTKDLAAMSGQSNPDSAYDVCFKANTVGTVSGTVRVTAEFAYV